MYFFFNFNSCIFLVLAIMFTRVNVSVRGQQMQDHWETERNLKELAPVIKGAGKFEICRAV